MAQTLYRKYRSQRFSELVGQTSVTRVLRNSITRGRLNHAYLFAGPRGTGKTSVARIFAKALNCTNPQDGDACGECDACLAVAAGTAVDVIEIDAASNRGIEDVRELRERVNYAPLAFPHKVYIIDEAHMITGPAFNALLKTLEEPPGFVIFCLCTTEAHKLPVTILSRCIRFDFQRLPVEALAGHLQWIAQQEGLALSQDAALKLAQTAEGSARDAISLLDQLTAYCSGEITLDAVHELFQLTDTSFAASIVAALASDDPVALLAHWHEMLAQGLDAGRFLLAIAGEAKARFLETRQDAYRAVLDVLWQGANMLKLESFPTLLVELTLLEAQAAWRKATGTGLQVEAAAAPTATAARQPRTAPVPQRPAAGPERRSSAPVAHTSPAASPSPAAMAEPLRPPTQRGPVRPLGPLEPEEPSWAVFLNEVKRRRLTAYSLLFNCAKAIASNGVLQITFRQDQRISFNALQRVDNAGVVLAAAAVAYGPGTGVALAVAGQPELTAQLSSEKAPPAAVASAELPDELVGDVIADPGYIPNQVHAADPAALHDAEQELYDGLRAAEAPAAEPKRPVTTQDAMDLFAGVELNDEEFGHEKH